MTKKSELQRVTFRGQELLYIPVPGSIVDGDGVTVENRAVLVVPELVQEDGRPARELALAQVLGLPHPGMFVVGNDEVRQYGEKVGDRSDVEFVGQEVAA